MAAERSTSTSVKLAEAVRARSRSKWRTRVAAKAARPYNRVPMNPENLRILVVDPEEESGLSVTRTLRGAAYQVRAVRTLRRALSLILIKDFDMVITALGVAGLGARAILARLRAASPGSAILIVAPRSEVDSAVRAMKEGADDYLTKPLDPYELRGRIGRILERRELNDRLADMQMALTRRYGLQSFVHHSPAMSSLVRKIAQVAPTSSTVLILGCPATM